MKNFKTPAILFIIILLLSTSCLKKKLNNELKTQQIFTYINDLGLDFDTIKSGILLHYTYKGTGNHYKNNDSIYVIYTGYYLAPDNSSNNTKFADNDTFGFIVGDREILAGWNDIATHFAQGGAGIAIFPYNKAYGDEQTPNIPANCNLVYFFRLLSNDYKITQNALFWIYAEQYDSIMTVFDDSLVYVKYFDGQGELVNPNGTPINYSLYDINDNLITEADSFFVDFQNNDLPTGLHEALSKMYEGEMGKIIIPPNLSFTDSNIYDIEPYSAIYFETRAIAEDPQIEQQSKIDKYLYLNNVTPDSILDCEIYYFKDKTGDSIVPQEGNTIVFNDSLYLINHTYPVSSCQNCEKILNSSNFFSGQIKAIKLMKQGESATFIIPYQEAYGSTGQGIIPPYYPLIYKIDLKEIK